MRNPLVAMDDLGIEAARTLLVAFRRRFDRGKTALLRDVRIFACALSSATAVVAFPISPLASVVGVMNVVVCWAHLRIRQSLPDDETVRGMVEDQKRSADLYVADRVPRIMLAIIASLLVVADVLDAFGVLGPSTPAETAVSTMLVAYYAIAASTRYVEAAPPPPPSTRKDAVGNGVRASGEA